MKVCKCEAWTKNINYLNACVAMARSHGFKLDTNVFLFCPYCKGQNRKEAQYD